VSATRRDTHIVVSVRDNGPGIPQSLLPQVFDPFFTTKEVGEGTGLGLSICFRIIEAHRGTIHVASDGKTYTEFYVSLPCPGVAANETKSSHHNAQFSSDLHEYALH
ncbi:MAG TPA: HAMP domain-containing sensor histidine kinase, partial [Methanothrix sp.]|nr:HAMP domain-containing sensor histidine kinase [Methanothrix sp.]